MKKALLYLLLVIDAVTVIGVFYIFLTYQVPETIMAGYLALLGGILQVICCVVGYQGHKADATWKKFYGYHLLATGLFYWFVASGGFGLFS